MKWWALAALLSFALVMGCIIIPDPPELKPPDPPPVEPGGVEPVPFPVLGGSGMRIAQLWFVRTDPGTSTLTSAYAQMMAQAKIAFEASGGRVEAVGVYALQDGRPLWATSKVDGGTAPVSIEDTFRYYAAHPWDAGFQTCPSRIPERVAADLQASRVSYPEELVAFTQPAPVQVQLPLEDGGFEDGGFVDGGGPYPHTVQPFALDVNAVFIAIIDSGARPADYFDFSCTMGGGQPAASYFAIGRPLPWIWSGELRFEPPQVAWALVGTSEDAGSSAMKSACLKYSSFPKPALDVISASDRALYTPWARHSVDYQSVVQSFDFCEAAAGEWQFGLFVNNWAQALTKWTVPQ